MHLTGTVRRTKLTRPFTKFCLRKVAPSL